MSPAPAEHSVPAFQSKNFNVLVSTIAALMLSALHWSKPSPEISVCLSHVGPSKAYFYEV